MAKKKKVKAKKRSIRPKARRVVGKPKAKKTKARAKRPVAAKKATFVESLEKVGEVTHYFPKVKAAAVKILKNSLKVGDDIYIKGHTTDFKEKVISMELDHLSIQEGKKGDEIGLLVKSRVRIGDSVYKI